MKLFGHAKATTATAERSTQGQARECPHTALAPHWDAAEDMGKHDKVSSYVCDACQQRYPREEGERMLTDVAARMRVIDASRHNNRG
jgi:hypothetical protein